MPVSDAAPVDPSLPPQPLTENEEKQDNGGVARVLSLAHFAQAFKEITPSSSETLGTLADLRKWNEEFGEGRKDKRRRLVWGKDRFGFNDKTSGNVEEDGRVLPAAPSSRSSRSGST